MEIPEKGTLKEVRTPWLVWEFIVSVSEDRDAETMTIQAMYNHRGHKWGSYYMSRHRMGESNWTSSNRRTLRECTQGHSTRNHVQKFEHIASCARLAQCGSLRYT